MTPIHTLCVPITPANANVITAMLATISEARPELGVMDAMIVTGSPDALQAIGLLLPTHSFLMLLPDPTPEPPAPEAPTTPAAPAAQDSGPIIAITEPAQDGEQPPADDLPADDAPESDQLVSSLARCAHCGQTFEPRNARSRLCSVKCSNAFYRAQRKQREAAAPASDIPAQEIPGEQTLNWLLLSSGKEMQDPHEAVKRGKIAVGERLRHIDGRIYEVRQNRKGTPVLRLVQPAA